MHGTSIIIRSAIDPVTHACQQQTSCDYVHSYGSACTAEARSRLSGVSTFF